MSTYGINGDAQVEPSMRMGDNRQNQRYPSPFFDVSQQYIPPTVKELFKWVYFYCTNNSFLGPAIGKIAKYPITDLNLEDENKEVVKFWQMLLNNNLQIKTFNMEVNLDLTSYGNGFVVPYFPFSRFLECPSCKNRTPWKAANKRIEALIFKMKCRHCGHDGKCEIRDVPYISVENIRLTRINPEYIDIKYNDASGRHTYLYNIPDKLKRQMMSGDPDILEDTPMVYIEAVRLKRKVKLSPQNIFHLKNPTLAGKDMGWGQPRLATALKDLYYFYTLRRGQEAVMNEQIVPFDILFPQANGKADPYVHSDLNSWRNEMKKQLAARRRDPNYKAIVPFPVGYQRIGGDGKALMLTPELDFLSKTIVGACGIPQEFVYGGTMNWSGSSISLRTLENDFLHQRSQLLQMNIWLIERIRLYLGVKAPTTINFTDFKMADDIQKLQLMIGLASNNKYPFEDVWKDLGKDPAMIRKKLEEESHFAGKMQENQAAAEAQAQAKGQMVMQRYQMRAQAEMSPRPQNGGPVAEGGPAATPDLAKTIEVWARKLMQQPVEERYATLERLHNQDPEFARLLAEALNALETGELNAQGIQPENAAPQPGPQKLQTPQQKAEKKEQKAAAKPAVGKGGKMPGMNVSINMKPMPEQRPPRRQGGI